MNLPAIDQLISDIRTHAEQFDMSVPIGHQYSPDGGFDCGAVGCFIGFVGMRQRVTLDQMGFREVALALGIDSIDAQELCYPNVDCRYEQITPTQAISCLEHLKSGLSPTEAWAAALAEA